MAITITGLTVRDIRFPTSLQRDGSDAMNPDPDYSAAYVVLTTDAPGLEGHGLTFTIGRGNELCVAAVTTLSYLVIGKSLASITADMGGFWRTITGDSQLRWLGPDKGVVHLATAAVVNAVWDLYAKAEGKPLWRLLCDLTPEQLVAAIDFRYLTDALTPGEAVSMLRARHEGKAARIREIERDGYPAYTTSAGWLGYDDAKIRQLAQAAIADGFTHLKMKVGRDPADDARRAGILREAIGGTNTLMMDANQVWEVDEAIERMRELARFKPWWIEEPTSPDDILGHARIARSLEPLGIRVATGEHCQNRIIFKQLLQARAIGICQIDSCRLGGVNEVLAVYLMAQKFGVPVCPHAGGVGLCEYVQHLSMWDYVSVSASVESRLIEYVDHLHQHFIDPCVVRRGRYQAPTRPGYSIEMHAQSLADHTFPTGAAWLHLRLRTARA